MKDFLKFLIKSHFFFLFLLLEAISIFLVVKDTNKKNIFITSANSFTGFLLEKTNYINSYFSLRDENNSLKKENEILKNYINSNLKPTYKISNNIEKTGNFYKSAKVIKNSIYKPNNIICLNKGKKDGILADMAVISDDGIVGIVTNTSNNYCTAISLLNSKISISAKIKRTNNFGSLKWDGVNYRFSILYDIPDHVPIFVGDEIVTTGFSSIFPEGLKIGTIKEFHNEGSFYNIKVKLSQDFNKLNNVYIVEFLNRNEIIQLEDSTYKQFQFFK